VTSVLLIDFLGGLAAVLAMVVLGNVAGWLTIRDAGYRPWNWRAAISPWDYYRWLDRKEDA
jgi:hypothetical protein